MGCGLHIPMVLDDIPKAEWCSCTPKKDVNGTRYPPMAGQGQKASSAKIEIGYED